MTTYPQKITRSAYSVALAFNGGEDEIVLIKSSGQSGHAAYMIVHASVDGGLEIVKMIPYGRASFSKAVEDIHTMLEAWFPNLQQAEVEGWFYGLED